MQRLLPFQFTPVFDAVRNSGHWLRIRVSRKIGLLAHRLGGIENTRQLGYAAADLRREAFQRPADLYIAHSESAMAVAADLLRAGHRVGVDMEDWFSEDLLPEARKFRPLRLLRGLEQTLLAAGVHATCSSAAMSQALAREFRCTLPTVIYNAFPWSERKPMDGLLKDRRDRRVPSIHWFSQTLGEGRGLEELFAALPLLKQEAEIHLRGKPVSGFDNWLANRVPNNWRSRVVIHELVSGPELLSRIAEHDIGFAGEMKYCRNKDLTVSNKILQYILAGIAVVASDTAGQKEVAEKASGAVFLYPSGDAAGVAARLDMLLGSEDALERAKAAALDAARQTFCWEQQERALLASVEQAFHSPRGSVSLGDRSPRVALASSDSRTW
jgi:glycosyltransferase involved in cell wall biosynthesis